MQKKEIDTAEGGQPTLTEDCFRSEKRFENWKNTKTDESGRDGHYQKSKLWDFCQHFHRSSRAASSALFIGTLSKTKKTLTKHQAQMQTRLTALCLKRWVGNVQLKPSVIEQTRSTPWKRNQR